MVPSNQAQSIQGMILHRYGTYLGYFSDLSFLMILQLEANRTSNLMVLEKHQKTQVRKIAQVSTIPM